MRSLIVDFLRKQKPVIICADRCDSGLVQTYSRVWLGTDDRYYSFVCYFTSLGIYNTKTKDSLEESLEDAITVHDTREEAIIYQAKTRVDYGKLAVCNSVLFESYIKEKAQKLCGSVTLLRFVCIDHTNGLYAMALGTHYGTISVPVLVGCLNTVYVSNTEQKNISEFLDNLFEKIIDFVVLPKHVIVENSQSFNEESLALPMNTFGGEICGN